MTQDQTEPRASILFAEDELKFRDAMAGLLKDAGYSCACAGDYKEAVALAEQQPFDLLLTDLRMPGNEGLKLARRALELSPTLAVVVLTGYPSAESAIEGIGLHVGAYLCKPVTFDELHETIEVVLAERRDELERSSRLDQLEEGFRSLARQLQALGHETGLLGEDGEINQVPELAELTRREWDVLRALLLGYRAAEIGDKLTISPFTVRNHLRSIFRKLGVRSQSELMLKLRPIPAH